MTAQQPSLFDPAPQPPTAPPTAARAPRRPPGDGPCDGRHGCWCNHHRYPAGCWWVALTTPPPEAP